MRKWMFLIAFFTLSCTFFVWGHPNQSDNHRHRGDTRQNLERENRQLKEQLNSIVNNYYNINNNPYHDHGHSYPSCSHHGCQIPCQHTFHTCPLITTNVVFPIIPITITIHASLLNACQNQYQWCLYRNPFYLQGVCTDQYFYCTGYNPYYPHPYYYPY